MIKNARDRRLDEQPALPDVSAAIDLLFQPLYIDLIQSSQVDGLTQNIPIRKATRGVRQPFTARQLTIRPEGERSWSWYTLHIADELGIQPDDIIIVHNMRMRVMERLDYREYGYIELHAIEDFNPDETRQSSP